MIESINAIIRTMEREKLPLNILPDDYDFCIEQLRETLSLLESGTEEDSIIQIQTDYKERKVFVEISTDLISCWFLLDFSIIENLKFRPFILHAVSQPLFYRNQKDVYNKYGHFICLN